MTKSTITREESVQAVFDLKVGYRLGFADLEILKRVARMALAAMDSESGCLPLDYLQGHKDGLEWAAQLAEANHPETGDWLYDDPIELAKAIRKGPGMPPAQPAADSEPVAYIDKQWTLVYYVPPMSMGLKIGDKLYRHAQPAPVAYSDFEEFWSAYIHPLAQDDELKDFAWDIWNACRAAMLAAATQPQNAPQNIPEIIPGWIPVSERMPDDAKWCVVNTDYGYYVQCWSKGQGWLGDDISIPNCDITHWMPIAAAPQEVKGES